MNISPNFKTTTFRSDKHLAFVRSHPCCVCGTTQNIHAHHLRIGHGMGKKAPDKVTVPLCETHYTGGPDYVHGVGSKLEMKWFKEHDVDALKLAQELFAASPHKTHKKSKRRTSTLPKVRRKIRSRGF